MLHKTILYPLLILATACSVTRSGNSKPAECPVDEKLVKYEKVKKFNQFSKINREYILWIATRPLILKQAGFRGPVDFSRYGSFSTSDSCHKYKITKRKALKKALGEGIYPNWKPVRMKEEFLKLQDTGLFEISHWDKIFIRYPKLGFYRWIMANESKGVRAFHIALSLERLGMYTHALKAFQSLFYIFPKTVAYTAFNTPFYPGVVARDKINWLLRRKIHGWHWTGSKAFNPGAFDSDLKNDRFFTKPGRYRSIPAKTWKDFSSRGFSITRSVGKGSVKLVQYANGGWQMRVNDRPFPVKAVSYMPTKTGRYPDGKYEANIDFLNEDADRNGKPDALYDSYIDRNRNGKRDPDEPRIGDAALLKQMGANTLRLYHHGDAATTTRLNKLHREQGLYFILGDFAGMYTIGSGASWAEGTDYTNPVHIRNMLASIKKMVLTHRDQPYVLMWLIGNESNYPVANNAAKVPDAFYSFVNRAAKLIKKLDPLKRPVAYSNGDLGLLPYFAKHCRDVDILGANVYREANGFGLSFFEAIKRMTGKPVIITEYGICAWSSWHTLKQAEDYQARYHRQHWMDLLYHMPGRPGCGNALGGVVFEFLDEWWKYEGDNKQRVKNRARQAFIHDHRSSFPLSNLDGLSYEEWFGLFSQGKGTDSPFLRIPRKAYRVYKKLWNRRYY